MFDRIIEDALKKAGIRPADFDAAIKREKFKSRIDWFLRGAPASLVEAYNNRVRTA